MRETPLVCVRPPSWIDRSTTTLWDLVGWAQTAEDLGMDGIFVGDRMLSEASKDGTPVYGASMMDATVVLATIAARTTSLAFGPLVMVVPFRHPVQLAKALASLDAASGGRLILGAGLGWVPHEFRTLGIEMSERASRFEESLGIMRRLWRGETVTTLGDSHWPMQNVAISPLPSAGYVPVWIASFSPDHTLEWPDGFSTATRTQLDRVGRLADAWVPLVYTAAHRRRISPATLAEAWSLVLAAAERAGRSRRDIDFVYSDWCYVIEDAADERRCAEALSGFFSGTWDEAKATYTIGTSTEVLEAIAEQTAQIDHVDAFVLTPLSNDVEQLRRVAGLAKALRGDMATTQRPEFGSSPKLRP